MPKNILRDAIRKHLKQINAEQRSEKSIKACRKLISTQQFKNAKVIMMFLSLPEEIDTTEAIESALKQGKTVAVPKVFWDEKYMIPVKLNCLDDDFSTTVARLRNPLSEEAIPVEKIDLVITPALGFDRKGHRIGRSGGFYDRFFADNKLRAIKCGLGFDEQMLDEIFVPTISTDVPLDMLVTDEKIMFFNEEST